MKKLQLKIRDLTNPTILTHHEIKNIMGGDSEGSGEIKTCYNKAWVNCSYGGVLKHKIDAASCATIHLGWIGYCIASYPNDTFDSADCDCN